MGLVIGNLGKNVSPFSRAYIPQGTSGIGCDRSKRVKGKKDGVRDLRMGLSD